MRDTTGVKGLDGEGGGRRDEGVFKRSRSMAFRCWREGAILGDENAMYALGLMFLKGCKVAVNDRAAFVYLRRAALGGHGNNSVA